MISLDGHVVLVTGGSRGIGAAVATRAAEVGATVVVHFARDAAAAEAVRVSLPGTGHRAAQADLGVAGEPARLVTAVLGDLGRIDVVVNNAGVYESHPVLSTSAEDWRASWDRTLAVNLRGPADLIHAVAPHLADRGSGCIVNVTSRGAYRGEPEHAAYGVAKAGLNSLTQSMAKALAPHGVQVVAVAPGFVETDMAEPYLSGPQGAEIAAQSPLGRAATPDEVARVIVFLSSPGSAYATGAIVDVNGASYFR